MTDWERTAEEREAARLERERRRAAQQDTNLEPVSDDQVEERPLGTRRVSRAERVGTRSRRAGDGGRPRPRSRGGAPPPARPRRGARRWIARLAALLVIAVAAVAVWLLVELYQPFGVSPHGRVTVVIPPKVGARRIGDILAAKGVVPSGFFFNLRAMLAGDRGKLLSGTYRLQLDMSYGAALKALMTPPPQAKVSNITLIEGLSRRQIDKLLRSQHIRGDYLAATSHSPLLNPTAYGAPRSTPSLEGFLFPDTYQLRDPITVAELVSAQLKTFKAQFGRVSMGYAAAHHLSPYDVLIIASMVQAEAQRAHDFPLVASVIYNRLRLGMRLQIDATTRYATGNYSTPLTQSQLNSPSPWNTRVHAGLPPTPINNPGLEAIQAAAHPAPSHYLFYITKPCGNGALAFASTDSAFNQLVAQYYAERAKLHGRSPAHC